ncbi:MAG: UDP-N-acetylmuramoyl-L-alanyl-D-glutamate synthetase [uncultured bacterium]|nr:MAG: UDP-N-acetylmuramoyl-L-alanyl-D-glutamate synthetase [uncultured bacterium]
MNKLNWQNKRIALLGFGIENQAVLEYLIKQGANDITICDKDQNLKLKTKNEKPQLKTQNYDIKYQLGKNYLDNLEQFDIVFRTPGIPYLTPEIQGAKKTGTLVTSQIKLFFDLCSAKIIGVTGTKGKGTTVSLITEILKLQITNYKFSLDKLETPVGQINSKSRISNFQNKSKILNHKSKIYCGGNIGNAPIEFVDKIKKDDWVVLELSSFQLQDLDKSPHIAVVLDIKDDHLDHHQDRDEYIDAKTSIVRYQSKDDFTVVNLDYLTAYKFALMSPTVNDYYFSRTKLVDLGTFVRWNNKKGKNKLGEIILRTEKRDQPICKTNEVTLRGEHNLENICAAITASHLAGASIKSIKDEVIKFKGLEHRLEFVKEIGGAKYYNDSFSTTPETAIAAIKSFSELIILIVGGSDKGANYTQLINEITRSTVKTLIAIGVTGSIIVKKLKTKNQKLQIIDDCKNMKEIVGCASKEAKPGDVILLSPASASFDMFANYKDRGEQFKSAVADL